MPCVRAMAYDAGFSGNLDGGFRRSVAGEARFCLCGNRKGPAGPANSSSQGRGVVFSERAQVSMQCVGAAIALHPVDANRGCVLENAQVVVIVLTEQVPRAPIVAGA